MAIALPNLPYLEDYLEPYMSKPTLRYHYGKHHKKYVDTTNKLIEGSEYADMDLESIVLHAHGRDQKLFNNAAQAWNHDFFWKCLDRKREPSAGLKATLAKDFDSVAAFKAEFEKTATELFGSGWAWLVRKSDGHLAVRGLKDADTPLVHGELPLLCCDVWEHAYYLDYQNDRPLFLKNFWNIANWDFVEANLENQIPKPALELAAKSQMPGSMQSRH